MCKITTVNNYNGGDKKGLCVPMDWQPPPSLPPSTASQCQPAGTVSSVDTAECVGILAPHNCSSVAPRGDAGFSGSWKATCALSLSGMLWAWQPEGTPEQSRKGRLSAGLQGKQPQCKQGSRLSRGDPCAFPRTPRKIQMWKSAGKQGCQYTSRGENGKERSSGVARAKAGHKAVQGGWGGA